MRTHSPFVVDVHELLEAPGVGRPLSFVASVQGLSLGDVAVRGEMTFDLELEAIDGGILVRGRVTGEFSGPCGRCVEPVGQAFELDIAEVYRPPGAVWEEGYVINEGTVDLERAVRDSVGLAIPLMMLCRPDCAGICPRCGANLNEGACDCPPEQGDPRWSVLRELGGRLGQDAPSRRPLEQDAPSRRPLEQDAPSRRPLEQDGGSERTVS